MTERASLIQSMHLPEETVQRIVEHGAALADLDTMSWAIHDVYCGITADHDHPNDKDRGQAQALLDAVQKHAAAPRGAFSGSPEA